ncbi:MAG TPA: hypothetical protein VKZ79_17095 [Alphaproteobacteria bacterium]|nr:hypothetical protein [Alphaproteobacteria bacterium]
MPSPSLHADALLAQPARAPSVGLGRGVVLRTIALGVWTTGAIWLLFHYYLRRPSSFGYQASPMEHWWLVLHGAFAFAAIAMLGFLWSTHIARGWASGARRRSGVTLLSIALFLVATGYLLYYAGDDGVRDLIAIAHWTVGLAALVAFVLHRYAKGLRRR